MGIHSIIFWLCLFFLLGVFFASFVSQPLFIILSVLMISVGLLIFRKYYFAWLILFMIVGASYFWIYADLRNKADIPIGAEKEFFGIVRNIEKSDTTQNLVLELQPPYIGNIEILARRYPEFNYGDLLKIKGNIQELPEKNKNYLLKNGIGGVLNFPKMELAESGRRNFIKANLLEFRNSIAGIFKSNLSKEKAAFLSGITLGIRENFSKELKNKMAISGTTHIVALSGYNISVIVLAVGALFGAYFSQAVSFYLSVSVIILFVLMTGAEASVVRAAIMGAIALLASHTQRVFSMRNAIIIAAFLMILFNPRILIFDVGFQLSFAALLGIVYLAPVLKRIFKFQNKGFLSWKENFITTISAQLSVAPLLMFYFGSVSLTSLIANVLILGFIPLTMGLGFAMAGLGFISGFLAKIIAIILNVLISYEFWVIDLFSKITLPIAAESLGFTAAIIYYLALVIFIYKFNES